MFIGVLLIIFASIVCILSHGDKKAWLLYYDSEELGAEIYGDEEAAITEQDKVENKHTSTQPPLSNTPKSTKTASKTNAGWESQSMDDIKASMAALDPVNNPDASKLFEQLKKANK